MKSWSRSVPKAALISACVGAATAFGSPWIDARRDALEAALVADDAAGRAELAREVAQVSLRSPRPSPGPVEPDRRERADVARPDRGGLFGLVVGDEERRAARPADHDEGETRDLDVPAGSRGRCSRRGGGRRRRRRLLPSRSGSAARDPARPCRAPSSGSESDLTTRVGVSQRGSCSRYFSDRCSSPRTSPSGYRSLSDAGAARRRSRSRPCTGWRRTSRRRWSCTR